ncbi:hypothetical protein PG994_011922 [Apiospora phragmitis]|uniref:Uncharacterized protein n=1 Tax=Apiospora phragmitis TaxID=2905665 RepID=A0ABR1TUB1_9PEZI
MVQLSVASSCSVRVTVTPNSSTVKDDFRGDVKDSGASPFSTLVSTVYSRTPGPHSSSSTPFLVRASATSAVVPLAAFFSSGASTCVVEPFSVVQCAA